MFKAAGALFVYATSEGELWSWLHGKDFKKKKKKGKRKTLGFDHVGVVWGVVKEKRNI